MAAVSDLLQPVLAGPLAAVAGRAAALAGDLAGQLLGQGWALLTFLMLLAVTPLVAFYLLRDWPQIIARIDEALPRAHAETIRAQGREMERVLAGFARGQMILCGVLALFYAAALSAIGLEFGVLLGLVAGLASFVPYLGTAVGLVASVGVAAVQFWPGWGVPSSRWRSSSSGRWLRTTCSAQGSWESASVSIPYGSSSESLPAARSWGWWGRSSPCRSAR